MSTQHHGHSHGEHEDGHAHSHGNGAHSHSHGGQHDHRIAPDDDKEASDSDPLIAAECGGLQRSSTSRVAQEKADRATRGLWIVSVLCVIAIVTEVVGGIIAHSLAILTDAAHLLSDLAGFMISLFAIWFTTKSPTNRLSFGFHRAEILGALVSVLLIWVVTGVLVYEAIRRVEHPEAVNGKLMFGLATGGLCINITMALILHNAGHAHSHGGTSGGHSHGGDLHGHSHGGHGEHSDERAPALQSAFIHVLGDAAQSVGVMIAAALIWYDSSWTIADPICTFVFSAIVLYTTIQLLREYSHVLMEGTPENIDPFQVEAKIRAVPHVVDVHDLHIWSLSVGKPSCSVHIRVDADANRRIALEETAKVLARQWGIHHSTIQVEDTGDNIHCNPDMPAAHSMYSPPAETHGHSHGNGNGNGNHNHSHGGHGSPHGVPPATTVTVTAGSPHAAVTPTAVAGAAPSPALPDRSDSPPPLI